MRSHDAHLDGRFLLARHHLKTPFLIGQSVQTRSSTMRAAAAVAAVGAFAQTALAASPETPSVQAKNVIYIVPDGSKRAPQARARLQFRSWPCASLENVVFRDWGDAVALPTIAQSVSTATPPQDAS